MNKKNIFVFSILVAFLATLAFTTSAKATSRKFDFWQIAKISSFVGVGGETELFNTVSYGEKGYVFNLKNAAPPYEVAGYTYVGSDDSGGGVTIFWYQEIPGYVNSTDSPVIPSWRACDPSENVFEEGMVGMEKAGEKQIYVWNSMTNSYQGPFHSVGRGQSGYTHPLVPGGNISGYYPGCFVDLGGGGKYYFYHPIEIDG